jgi:hypothetical protein
MARYFSQSLNVKCYINVNVLLTCITVYQYSETNVMHFLFSLLRIKGLYMFRALLAHPRRRCTSDTWYIACILCQLAATSIGVEFRSTPIRVAAN